jgi:hypothetical protein
MAGEDADVVDPVIGLVRW